MLLQCRTISALPDSSIYVLGIFVTSSIGRTTRTAPSSRYRPCSPEITKLGSRSRGYRSLYLLIGKLRAPDIYDCFPDSRDRGLSLHDRADFMFFFLLFFSGSPACSRLQGWPVYKVGTILEFTFNHLHFLRKVTIF